jgi:hypothetical protein
MSHNAKNPLLADCYSRLLNIVHRLCEFSQDKGNEIFNDIKFDFEALQTEFQEFSFGLDPHDKDIQLFTGRMEVFEQLFKKLDEMLPL